jgi:hypothetical protein
LIPWPRVNASCSKCGASLLAAEILYDDSASVVCQRCSLGGGVVETITPEEAQRRQRQSANREKWRRRADKANFALNFAAPLLLFVPAMCFKYWIESPDTPPSDLWMDVGIPVTLALSLFVVFLSTKVLWRLSLALGVLLVTLGLAVFSLAAKGVGGGNQLETLWSIFELGIFGILVIAFVSIALVVGAVVMLVLLLVRLAKRASQPRQ